MYKDALGLTLTAGSADASLAFDHVVSGYLSYRADGMQRLGALLRVAPRCVPRCKPRGRMTYG